MHTQSVAMHPNADFTNYTEECVTLKGPLQSVTNIEGQVFATMQRTLVTCEYRAMQLEQQMLKVWR